MNCKSCNRSLRVAHATAKCDENQTPDPRHQIRRVYRDAHGNRYAYDYVVGFGFEGNGHFCSKDCGYQWALKVIKNAEENREEYQRAFD